MATATLAGDNRRGEWIMPILMVALIALAAFGAIGVLLALAVILERKGKDLPDRKTPIGKPV
jgi:uncharacterized membrane protein (DUF4010 family)